MTAVQLPRRRALRVPAAWRRPAAVAGAAVLLAWVLVALLDPVLGLQDPLQQSVAEAFRAPSAAHPFGTDALGRDVLSRTLWGVRASLPLAVALVAGSLVIGSVLGALAGFLGGVVDEVVDPARTRSTVAQVLLDTPGVRGQHGNIPL